MRARPGVVVVAALALALTCVAPAGAAPPRPAELNVVGYDGWRPESSFDLQWANPALDGGAPLAAVHYRIRDPAGRNVAAARLGWVTDGIAQLRVPPVPGAYTAEVWLEDAAGEEGAAAVALLRFDDRRPAATALPQIRGWIGRTAFPLTIRLGRPAVPSPISGIRGYAVAIDSIADGVPCIAPDRCSVAETTLGGGPGDDTLTIAALPEGGSQLHAVSVSGSGMKSATTAHTTLEVDTTDPVTTLAGAASGWVDDPVVLTATATDAGSGMAPDGSGPPPITAIQVDGNAPASAVGKSVAVTVIDDGTHEIAYYARDAAGNANDGGDSNGIANRAPSTVLVRIDGGPPSVSFANSQIPGEPELIRVQVADALSGPDLSRGEIGIRRAASGDPFQPLPSAAPVNGELRAHWDSEAYPAGDYELRAIGYDVAGNATVTTRRANGAAMVLSNPLKVTTALRTGFGGRTMTWHRCTRRGGRRHCRREIIADFGRRPASRTVPYGRRVRLSGRLIAATSAPLAGMPVRIVERFADGATRLSTVRTASGGAFSTQLAPGATREVVASFDGGPVLSRATGRSLRLRVRSRVRMRASAAMAEVGGAPLDFRGRIEAPPEAIPPKGLSVQLQFRLPGLRWAEFRTVQTDRRGRFRYAYRFSDDDSRGARFQFRAYAPPQDGWPYEPGGSRPVAVRGH